MPYSPLYSGQPLPTIGVRREDLNYDFKGKIDGQSDAELAKDVAAFANAAGGTILVGATESSGALSGWIPLTADEAHRDRDRYSRAVKDKCSPVPLVDPHVIEPAPGQFAVAVNVSPYTLLPVAVRVTSNQITEGKAWDAWIIWVRVGVDSKPFTPEQAAMLMIPEVRRTMTLLDSIPTSKRKCVRAYYRMPQMNPESARYKKSYLDLVEVRPHENAAVFRGSEFQRDGYTAVLTAPLLHIPLDHIVSVWSLAGGDWCLSLKGQIQTLHDEPIYIPNE